MTNDDRKALFEIAKRSGIEAVVVELSSIASWQEITCTTPAAKTLWRDVELRLDRLTQNLPLTLRNISWGDRKPD